MINDVKHFFLVLCGHLHNFMKNLFKSFAHVYVSSSFIFELWEYLKESEQNLSERCNAFLSEMYLLLFSHSFMSYSLQAHGL